MSRNSSNREKNNKNQGPIDWMIKPINWEPHDGCLSTAGVSSHKTKTPKRTTRSSVRSHHTKHGALRAKSRASGVAVGVTETQPNQGTNHSWDCHRPVSVHLPVTRIPAQRAGATTAQDNGGGHGIATGATRLHSNAALWSEQERHDEQQDSKQHRERIGCNETAWLAGVAGATRQAKGVMTFPCNQRMKTTLGLASTSGSIVATTSGNKAQQWDHQQPAAEHSRHGVCPAARLTFVQFRFTGNCRSVLAVHATGLGTVTARVTEPSGDPVGPVH